jgi:hypothetical protein
MRTGDLASVCDIARLGRTAQQNNQPDKRAILSFIRLCRDRNNGRPFRAHVTVTVGELFVRDDFIPLLERKGEKLHKTRQFNH